MFRPIAPDQGENRSEVKYEATDASSGALVLSRHNLLADQAALDWFSPEALANILFQNFQSQISKQRQGILTALAEIALGPYSILPSFAERQRTLFTIQAAERYSSNLAGQIRQARRALQELEDNMSLDGAHLEALKWSISALKRVPDEVLGEIFEVYVLELHNSPWTLTSVSRSFRRAAFATRRIWSRIRLDQPRPFLRTRWIGNREMCTTVKQLTAALERSHRSPLDIMVNSCTEDMARLLVAEWKRWEFFTYHCNIPAITSILLSPSRPTQSSKLVKLTDVANKYFHRWLQAVRPVALNLHGCNVVEFDSIRWWQELRELCFDFTNDAICRHMTASILSSIMATRHQLTRLELRDIPLEANRMHNNLVLSSLIELKVVNVSSWWKLRSDRLEKLIVSTNAEIPDNAAISYSNLIELDYDCTYFCLPTETLSLPRLNSLVLRNMGCASPGHNFIWLTKEDTPSECRPRKLTLINCLLSYKILLPNLRPYQSLEFLYLQHTKLPLSFFKAFGVHSTSISPMLCPNLKEMVVDMLDLPKVEESRFAETFEYIVSMRKTSQQMDKLLVTWPKKSKRSVEDFAKVEK